MSDMTECFGCHEEFPNEDIGEFEVDFDDPDFADVEKYFLLCATCNTKYDAGDEQVHGCYEERDKD